MILVLWSSLGSRNNCGPNISFSSIFFFFNLLWSDWSVFYSSPYHHTKSLISFNLNWEIHFFLYSIANLKRNPLLNSVFLEIHLRICCWICYYYWVLWRFIFIIAFFFFFLIPSSFGWFQYEENMSLDHFRLLVMYWYGLEFRGTLLENLLFFVEVECLLWYLFCWSSFEGVIYSCFGEEKPLLLCFGGTVREKTRTKMVDHLVVRFEFLLLVTQVIFFLLICTLYCLVYWICNACFIGNFM
jgi:hypothetical protein